MFQNNWNTPEANRVAVAGRMKGKCRKVGSRRAGTWDSAAVLAPGYTSSNKIQRDHIGLKIIVHVQLGQILDKRFKETKKPNCHFEECGAKAGGSSKSRVLCMPPAHNTT